MPKPQDFPTLGERIAQGRRQLAVQLARDITPADLAKMLDVDSATVYRWESNEKAPREGALAALASLFNVSPAYLRYGVRESVEPSGFPQPDPTQDRLLTEDEIERARRAVARKEARKKPDGHRRGA